MASFRASAEMFAASSTALVTSSSSTVAYPSNFAVAAAIQVSGVMPFFARASGSWPLPISRAMPSKTEPSMLGGATKGSPAASACSLAALSCLAPSAALPAMTCLRRSTSAWVPPELNSPSAICSR